MTSAQRTVLYMVTRGRRLFSAYGKGGIDALHSGGWSRVRMTTIRCMLAKGLIQEYSEQHPRIYYIVTDAGLREIASRPVAQGPIPGAR